MEIHSIDEFIHYSRRVRERTKRLFTLIPEDKIEWRPAEGFLSFGDLIRHISFINRWMYGETIQQKPSKYKGHFIELLEGEDIFENTDRLFEEIIDIVSKLDETFVQTHCKTPTGSLIRIWKWLRAMIEHEIHHRGQIYTYLRLLDITTVKFS